MSKSVSPNADAIAKDLVTSLTGKLDQPKLDAAVASLLASKQTYSAKGTLASFVIYFKVFCYVDGGKNFAGSAWGFGTPPGTGTAGDLRTEDVDKLYRETTRVHFTSTLVYLSILFFDDNANLLGHYDGGGIGVGATGTGPGSWS
jgi:hypothetical protein